MTNDTAAIATLNIRTTALEGRVNELTNAINGVQTNLSAEIRGIAATLSSKIEERGRTPWSIIIGGFAAALSLYAYIDNAKLGPLKDKDADLVMMMKDLTSNVSANMVPVRVHTREWQQNDERFQRLEERIKFGEGTLTDRVKRVEEMFGNAYNLRDAIQQLDNRVQHFERMSVERRAAN